MFETNLPSTQVKEPFSKKDIDSIRDNFTDSEQNKIFYKNTRERYSKQEVAADSKGKARSTNRGNQENE